MNPKRKFSHKRSKISSSEARIRRHFKREANKRLRKYSALIAKGAAYRRITNKRHFW